MNVILVTNAFWLAAILISSKKNKDKIISLILVSQSIFSGNLTSLDSSSKKVPLVTHDFFSIFEIYRVITSIVEHFKEI